MADLYLDSTTGDNADNGTTPALAWDTIAYANANMAAGDTLWVRRLHSEALAAVLSLRTGSSWSVYTSVKGWPRGTVTSTGTFTHGSVTVSSVSITCGYAAHCGRFIKNDADGRLYLITRVPSTSSFTLDRPYVGTTATGAFTISEDEDYATRPATGQAAWDGDAHALPLIDCTGTAYYIYTPCGCHFTTLRNIQVKGGTNAEGGAIFYAQGRGHELLGCLLSTTENNIIFGGGPISHLKRCIVSGSSSGANQNGIRCNRGIVYLTDCAIYGMGNYGIVCPQDIRMYNVNIGVEVANGSLDIYTDNACVGGDCRTGYDVKLGGTNGYIGVLSGRPSYVYIENYQKTLGRHYGLSATGNVNKVDAGSGTPIPNQRLGGSPSLLEILPNGCMTGMVCSDLLVSTPIFTHTLYVNTANKSYRYYVQTNIAAGLTAAELYLELTYVDQYSDTTKYHVLKVRSDETITVRSGITDWSQYLEIPNIAPAIAGNVIIKCFLNRTDATYKVWIDPRVVIR